MRQKVILEKDEFQLETVVRPEGAEAHSPGQRPVVDRR